MIEIKITGNTVGEIQNDCRALLSGTEHVFTKGELSELADKVPSITETEIDTRTDTTPQSNGHPPIPDTAKKSADDSTETQTSDPAGVELDSQGYPWDERIHSTKKSQTSLGIWKPLRIPKKYKGKTKEENDVAGWDAYQAEIKAELKAALPTPETENPDPNAEFDPPAGQNQQEEPFTFDDLMKYIGGVNPMIVLDTCAEMDIANIFEIQPDDNEAIAEFMELIKQGEADE